MNELKHTPGPWEVGTSEVKEVDKIGEEYMGVGNFDVGRSVCRVSRFSTVDAQDFANAALIAASPMMFAYIKARADGGDKDAAKIIAEITG